MNKVVIPIIEKIIMFIYSFFYKYFKKIEEKYLEAIYRKCYLESIKLFPNMKLSKSHNFALNIATKLIFELNFDEEKINKNKLQKVEELIINDDWVKRTLSDLNRMKAFFIFYNKEKQKEYLEKAIEYVENVKEIKNISEIRQLHKDIKVDAKTFLKESKKLNDIKFEKLKLKIIKPIDISSSLIIFIITLFSAFFLLSGIIHNKLLFYVLDINISDFYSISDYISTSIEVIFYTLLFSFVGIFSYFLGYLDNLKQSIYEEQFNLEEKTFISKFKNVIFFTFMMLFTNYLLFGRLDYMSLFPLSFVLFIILLNNLPFWKYVKNKSIVMNFIIMVFIYIFVLFYNVFSKIDDLKSEDYKNPYKIIFKDKNINYQGYKFITSNSSYVFLLNKETYMVKVIPIYEIKEFSQIDTSLSD